MRIEAESNITVIVADSVICNRCGEEIKKNEFGYFDEHLHIEKKWGYGSRFDGDTHSFDLCHACYEWFIDSFKLKTTVTSLRL